ncbi:hypothetical protein ACOMHN_026657 [Nucella lapillus]
MRWDVTNSSAHQARRSAQAHDDDDDDEDDDDDDNNNHKYHYCQILCLVPHTDQFQCPPSEVKCPGTQRCIISTHLCDGDNDCDDNWDENTRNCPHTTRPH